VTFILPRFVGKVKAKLIKLHAVKMCGWVEV